MGTVQRHRSTVFRKLISRSSSPYTVHLNIDQDGLSVTCPTTNPDVNATRGRSNYRIRSR